MKKSDHIRKTRVVRIYKQYIKRFPKNEELLKSFLEELNIDPILDCVDRTPLITTTRKNQRFATLKYCMSRHKQKEAIFRLARRRGYTFSRLTFNKDYEIMRSET